VIVYKPEKKSASADKDKINCPIIKTDSDNIVIETIKQAQDGKGLIVRLYENFRQRGHVTINAGFKLKKVYKTNLLENNKQELSAKNDTVKLYVKPYEIINLRLIPA
jgi:alpha-mannosidase